MIRVSTTQHHNSGRQAGVAVPHTFLRELCLMTEAVEQGVVNYSRSAASFCKSNCIQYSQAHSFRHMPRSHRIQKSSVVTTEFAWPANLKYLLSGLLRKSLLTLVGEKLWRHHVINVTLKLFRKHHSHSLSLLSRKGHVRLKGTVGIKTFKNLCSTESHAILRFQYTAGQKQPFLSIQTRAQTAELSCNNRHFISGNLHLSKIQNVSGEKRGQELGIHNKLIFMQALQ